MLQTTEQVINKLKVEFTEIRNKIINLETFMLCSDYLCLSYEEQNLLEKQRVSMVEYKDILLQRLMLLISKAENARITDTLNVFSNVFVKEKDSEKD